MKNLFDLRRNFSLKKLNEEDVSSNPILQFETWFEEAKQSEIIEPNAMNLATVGKNGMPSSRTVLLKQIKEEGFIFFSNYESKKAQQIDENKYCALNFTWNELERQVRIEGIAEKIPPSDSDNYFEMRPPQSKLGAWASPQSKEIPNRLFLEELIIDFEQKFALQGVSRPPNWGGYIVKPYLFEFWQGRPNRLHDRLQYKLENGFWKIARLAP